MECPSSQCCIHPWADRRGSYEPTTEHRRCATKIVLSLLELKTDASLYWLLTYCSCEHLEAFSWVPTTEQIYPNTTRESRVNLLGEWTHLVNLPGMPFAEIRKRLFGIFTVRRKWLHKHALFCKFKVSQCWMQRNLLLEPCKHLNIVRKKHSQLFMSFMNFRCISSAIWSVKLPSLAVRGGTVGTFCIAATANVS